MKKSFKIFGLLAFALISITACTEDNSVSPTAAIVGFWGVDDDRTAFYIDNQLVQADTTLYAADEFTLNFTSDGLAIAIMKDSTGAYTNDTAFYSLTGTNMLLIDKSSTPFDTTNFTAVITGNKLKLGGSQVDTSVFGVTKVDFEYNATKLVK